jgi:subtilisin family serine protease
LTKGEGVTLFVFDDGFDIKHPEFAGLDIVLEDFTGEGNSVIGKHGTHVLSSAVGQKLVDGIAPKVKRVYGFKVLKASGSGSFDYMRKALDRAREIILRDKIKAVGSASLGSAPTQTPVDQFDPRLQKSIQGFLDTGSPLVVAMGNDGPSQLTAGFPARYAETMKVIAVCSCNNARNISNFSSRGPAAVVTGQGEAIVGATPGNTYSEWDGTSMITPQIAGAVCLWMALYGDNYTGLDRVEAACNVVRYSSSFPDKRDTNRGYGLLDCSKIVLNVGNNPVTPPQPPVARPGTVTITFSDLSPLKQEELKKAGVDVFTLTVGHSNLTKQGERHPLPLSPVPELIPTNVVPEVRSTPWPGLPVAYPNGVVVGASPVPLSAPVPATMPGCPGGNCPPQPTRSIPWVPRLWK